MFVCSSSDNAVLLSDSLHISSPPSLFVTLVVSLRDSVPFVLV